MARTSTSVKITLSLCLGAFILILSSDWLEQRYEEWQWQRTELAKMSAPQVATATRAVDVLYDAPEGTLIARADGRIWLVIANNHRGLQQIRVGGCYGCRPFALDLASSRDRLIVEIDHLVLPGHPEYQPLAKAFLTINGKWK